MRGLKASAWLAVLIFTASIEAFMIDSSSPVGVDLRKRMVGRKITPPPSFRLSFCRMPNCFDCPPTKFPYCAVINDAASEDSFSDSGSEASLDMGETKTAALFGIQSRQLNIKDSLLKVSNWASLLCVLDCTILPIVTLILPLFGIVAASPAQMEWLHEVGHSVALYFVMPVGGLATTMNYTQHRKKWITAIGWLGLLAVLSANAGCHSVHRIPGALGHYLHKGLHYLHHGVVHRVTNLAGCALLMTSNYLSHKQEKCKDPACAHHH
jgi:hypothetical protein